MYYIPHLKGGATLIGSILLMNVKKRNSNLLNYKYKRKNKKYLNKNVKIIKLNETFTINSLKRFFTSFLSSLKLIELFFSIKSKNSLYFHFQSHILPILISKLFFRKIIFRNSEDIIEATKYADQKFSVYNFFF